MSKLKYCISMIVKFVLKNYFLRVYNVNYKYVNFNPKQKGPFFLIGNHVLLMDAFFCNFVLKGYAIPVVNAFVYTDVKKRIGMTKMIDSIVKRKGQSDIQTIRSIRKFVKNGNSIALYPEGNTSYYGTNTESMYATAKLLKMQKIDVVVAKTSGGYLAKPRWRKSKTKKPYVEIEMSLLFTKEQLKDMSVEDIYDRMVNSYKYNDYEWNRNKNHKYIGKNRLEGAHRVIYGCPTCESINTIKTSGDSIVCTNCKETGIIDDYGYINNTIYDNFVDWGAYQETLLREKRLDSFVVEGEYYKIDWDKNKKIMISKNCILNFSNKVLVIESLDTKEIINVEEIKGEAYTESNEFSFDYKDQTYLFITESPKFLLDLVTTIKEA